MKRLAVDHLSLSRRYGITFLRSMGVEAQDMQFMNPKQGWDAQPTLITAANAGIPSLFTTYVDPKIIEVLISPVKAAVLYGETKKGTWVDDTAMFLMAERTGEVASYGDFSQDGMSDSNEQFPQRQSYHYQTNTRWGEREVARAAAAKIDKANQKNMASAMALKKFENQSYLYGIAGLQCYGGTNDPALLPPLVPTATWYGADGALVYGDIQRMVIQVITQCEGLVDSESVFSLGLSPQNAGNLNNTNTYNVNVMTQLKTNYPNMKIVTVPEFAINGGGNAGGTEFVQLIVDSIEGQGTTESAFTEKMRAHAIVTKTSSWEQKKSSGTWGTIIYMPVGIVAMIGA